VVACHLAESFCPLVGRAEYCEIQVQFCNAEDVSFSFFDGCPNLMMFVAVRIDW
jgi:hypothetical protein